MTISQVDSTDAGPLIAILASVIWIPVGLVGIPVALMGMMGVGSSGWALLGLIGGLTFPIACFATVPIVWTVWVKTRKRAGTTKWRVLAALVPFVSVAVLLIGIGGTEAFCGGSLRC